MKPIILAATALLFLIFSTRYAADSTIALPKPQLDKGKPLMQVLRQRHSTREIIFGQSVGYPK